MHGQSVDYTPLKQAQLESLLTACYPAWSKRHIGKDGKPWDAPMRYFGDCMAGSGYDDQGNPGSPLIFRDFARGFDDAWCIWCDVNPRHTEKLSDLVDYNCDILTGEYQLVMREYLEKHVPRMTMGLIYLDDNGCQQVWEDDGFLSYVMTNYRYLDIAIHFSENAWKRNSGAKNNWALQKHVMEVFELMLHHKPESVIYAPRVRHNWRLVYGCRSGKMNLQGQNRIKLRDYIESRPENQPLLLEGLQ